jgi:hypothetical protein
VDRPSRARTWSSLSACAIGALRGSPARRGSYRSAGPRPAGFGARREGDGGGGLPFACVVVVSGSLSGRELHGNTYGPHGLHNASPRQRAPRRPCRENGTACYGLRSGAYLSHLAARAGPAT